MTDLERFVARLVEILEQRDLAALHRPIPIKDLRDSVIPYRFNRSILGLTSSEEYELLLLRLIAEEGGLVRVSPPDTAERLREELAGPNPDLELIEVLGDTTVQLGPEGIARAREVREELTRPGVAGTRTIYAAPPETAAAAASDETAPAVPGTVSADAAEPAATDAGLPEAAAPEARRDEWAPLPPATDTDPAAGGPPPELAKVAPLADEPEFEPLADSITVEEEPEASPPPASVAGDPESAAPAPHCASCDAALPAHRPVAFCPFCGAPAGVRRCVRCGSEIEPGWKHCVACGHLASPTPFA